jgi:hypothetical protein
MITPITLESIYTLLSDFISKQTEVNIRQESFNAKQESFNAKQESFNAKQESFNAKADANFSSLQEGLDSIKYDMAEFRREEKANHNLSHRMIMQSFEAISDIRSDLDRSPTEPWLRK